MNNEISIYLTNELEQYATQIQEALVSAGFTDGDDNSELVQDWQVARPFECVMRLFVLANETDMVAIQNAIIEAIYNATGIRLVVNFVHGCVTWFDIASMPETVSEFTIQAGELGFDEDFGFDPSMVISMNREPKNERERAGVSEFIEANFPLTQEDVSHGITSKSCRFFFED